MNVLSKAIQEYNNKNYKLALDLFEKAGEIYGMPIVDFNIKKCRQALEYKENNILPSSGNIEKSECYLVSNKDFLALKRENRFLTEMVCLLQIQLEKNSVILVNRK